MSQKTLMHKVFPFLTWMKLITKETMKDDLRAGLTGTIIVIPQAVAFAIIAGMPPVYGFYIAMVAPIVAALWGSSYHLISGPTTTSSIVVFSIITKYYSPETELEAYISLTILLSFMAGVIKLLMGVFKMGKLVDFVSNSVVLGFTAGAGILIAFKQLKHIFGMPIPQGSSIANILTYITTHLNETNLYAVSIAAVTFFSAILIKKYIKFISKFGMLLAMVIGTLVGLAVGPGHGIETVTNIPNHLPPFNPPAFNLEWMKKLFGGAVILALLGLVEAVSISKSIALHSHQRLDNNQEFIGQGLSNIIPSFFSCYASSGSFTRSGVNYQSGAKTPMSAIFAALGLMLVLVFGAKYASMLPKPAMGGIILLVGYNLIDIEHIKKIIKSCGFPKGFPKSWSSFVAFFKGRELNVFLATMFGTIFFHDLQNALLVGIFLSFIYYLDKTSQPYIATIGRNKKGKFVNIIRDHDAKEYDNLKIVRIDGALYFGAIDYVSDYFSSLYEKDIKNILIVSNGISFIDLTGAEWLEHEAQNWAEKGGGLYFSNMSQVAQDIIINANVKASIGEDHFFATKHEAVEALT